jgi:hypothetical protein
MFTLCENFGCGQHEAKLKMHLETLHTECVEFFHRKVNEFKKKKHL